MKGFARKTFGVHLNDATREFSGKFCRSRFYNHQVVQKCGGENVKSKCLTVGLG